MDKIKVDTYRTSYALINYDGVNRCAWCNKPTDEIKDLDKHLISEEIFQELENSYAGSEELLYGDFIKIREKYRIS